MHWKTTRPSPGYLGGESGAFNRNPFRGAFIYFAVSFQSSSTRFSSRLAFSDAAEKPQSSGRRSITRLDPITEVTPTKDLRDVSTFLKHPPSPESNASQVPLPPSPSKSLIERLHDVPVQSVVRQLRGQEILQTGNELVISLRSVSEPPSACIGGLNLSRSVLVKLPQHLVCNSYCRVGLYSIVYHTVARI